MAPPEKLRRSRDVEAACRGGTPSPLHIVEFSREKKRRWKAGLLLASLLAATAIVFAVIGLVTGLGVMVRSGGDYSRGCSTEDAHVAEDTANNVSYSVQTVYSASQLASQLAYYILTYLVTAAAQGAKLTGEWVAKPQQRENLQKCSIDVQRREGGRAGHVYTSSIFSCSISPR